MARIKVTGYLDIEDADADPGHSTGMSGAGFDGLAGVDRNNPLSRTYVRDLEDLTTETAED